MALRLEHQLEHDDDTRSCSCRADWQHGTAVTKKQQQQALGRTTASSNGSGTTNDNRINGDSTTTFWIAPIRDPSSRALSSVYFHEISFHARASAKVSPSINFVTDHLHKVPENYIFHYVRLDDQQQQQQQGQEKQRGNDDSSASTSQQRDDMAALRTIVSSYDFLLVVDRLDESLVLLSILMNVPVTHLLTVNSKQAGSWYSNQKRCLRLYSPSRTMRTELERTVFASDAWTVKHALDQLLYDIASASLTATIRHHQAAFDVRWREYQTWQERIKASCAINDVFPCSFDGRQQLNVSSAHCYLRDFGCGYPCIDELVKAASS
jgi:hypothetical protein